MFGIEKEDLKDLLTNAHKGQLQLPDFQRDYVWTDEDVRSLIASVAKGYPVGALLTLQTGGEVDFKPRVLEGVTVDQAKPDELLLDGQQRMTSLYQAAFSKAAVRTRTPRGTEVDRFYYIDIRSALSAGADLEECIIGVPADRVIRENFGRNIKLDLSTRENEFEHHMFPLNQVFDSRDWFYDWRDYWKARGEDAQRRFRVMENVEELEKALEYRWEKWTIFLHPSQRRYAERSFNGPVRVGGTAGTGVLPP